MDQLPFKYLGVPIHFDKLKRDDLQSVIDRLLESIWMERKIIDI
jgi:hypothetical protein